MGRMRHAPLSEGEPDFWLRKTFTARLLNHSRPYDANTALTISARVVSRLRSRLRFTISSQNTTSSPDGISRRNH